MIRVPPSTSIVIAATLSSCITDPHVEPPPAWTLQQQHDATVEIQPCGGSGALIGDRIVLTASHVACSGATVTTADGVTLPTSLLWRDDDHDLALLTVPAAPSEARDHATVDETIAGDVVCAEVALPTRYRACGRVTDVRSIGTPHGAVDLQISIGAVPGNSGSALYDDYGHLVGVVTSGVYGIGLASSVSGRLPK